MCVFVYSAFVFVELNWFFFVRVGVAAAYNSRIIIVLFVLIVKMKNNTERRVWLVLFDLHE